MKTKRRDARRPKNVAKLERLLSSVKEEVRQAEISLDKYKRNPDYYAPQLENLSRSAVSIASAMRVLYRELGGEWS
jgi:hypothetical protein